MLDLDTRRAILRLREKGVSLRKIVGIVGSSRNAVRRVLRQGTEEVPKQQRSELLQDHEDTIRALILECRGNRVRVEEKLTEQGIDVSYSTLTAFMRRHDIAVKEKKPSGRYHFEPGTEMQHDTSPHIVNVDGKQRRLHCASLVLCFSRMIYAQVYPKWDRFHTKLFLDEALHYFDGLCDQCMIDNASVIVSHGTGVNAVIAPEMEAYGKRYGYHFRAHELGDKNRSGRVERPFHYIENNFYPGRVFSDMIDVNCQLRTWCDCANHRFKKHIRAIPLELFAIEKSSLKPLPPYLPEIYQLHHRIIDSEANVNLHTNHYSAPPELIGRRLEVHESKDRVRLFDGHREVAVHSRLEPGLRKSQRLPEHQYVRLNRSRLPLPEETLLENAGQEFALLLQAIRKKRSGSFTRAVKILHRLYLDYPEEPLRAAIEEALQFGLVDLSRIEKMVLKRLAKEFFRFGEDQS